MKKGRGEGDDSKDEGDRPAVLALFLVACVGMTGETQEAEELVTQFDGATARSTQLDNQDIRTVISHPETGVVLADQMWDAASGRFTILTAKGSTVYNSSFPNPA